MMTSKQWWAEIKTDQVRFNDWLVKQYRGEVTAADRIEAFAEKYANSKNKRVLNIIASQERQHAEWVLQLLQSRNIEPNVEGAERRYWQEVLPEIESFETGAAVGAHAEAMRLDRIRAICSDEQAPEDVRKTFQLILMDEVFHERAFRKMAGPAAMTNTTMAHSRGRELLGLEP